MTFEETQHPRETDGKFAEKTGADPEVSLSPALRGGKNGVYWREGITSEEWDDLAVRVSGFIDEHPDILSLTKVRVTPAAKLPYEHYAHNTDDRDAEYPLAEFLLHYKDDDGEDRKLFVGYYDTSELAGEGTATVNDALYEAVYEARVGSQHPEDEFFDVNSGVYAEFGSASRASAYYESARRMHGAAGAFFGDDKLEELMNGEA